MFLTNILLKKVKSKYVLVLVESVASGHRIYLKRERIIDKLEISRFDPYVQAMALYRETKKVCSL
ncbi:mitochondrial ribosomal protein L33 [Ptiloglossa arizonensis]|uniref:mitochondrial ribosomal protein L33 n=1 Tax=Ptiloglossa arizonensis TaxID=3350558 RepID=UPI003FA19384